jgi:hypothetical protein
MYVFIYVYIWVCGYKCLYIFVYMCIRKWLLWYWDCSNEILQHRNCHLHVGALRINITSLFVVLPALSQYELNGFCIFQPPNPYPIIPYPLTPNSMSPLNRIIGALTICLTSLFVVLPALSQYILNCF